MLELKDIVKIYNIGTPDEQTALDCLNLTINDGEFVTVIGGNGSGKSTMQNVICGSVFPNSGKVFLDGADITAIPEHKRAEYLGRVYQDPQMGTAADMQIQENLALAYRRGNRRSLLPGIRKEERVLYRTLLAGLGLNLEDRMTAKVGTLSGGQRQALTLLMASLASPKLLMLDEHTAALDPKTAARVMELTQKIVRENRLTTLMVTHNMKDAIAYGDRLIMLDKGKIILDIYGEEKKALTVEKLLKAFNTVSGDEFSGDRAVLS